MLSSLRFTWCYSVIPWYPCFTLLLCWLVLLCISFLIILCYLCLDLPCVTLCYLVTVLTCVTLCYSVFHILLSMLLMLPCWIFPTLCYLVTLLPNVTLLNIPNFMLPCYLILPSWLFQTLAPFLLSTVLILTCFPEGKTRYPDERKNGKRMGHSENMILLKKYRF